MTDWQTIDFLKALPPEYRAPDRMEEPDGNIAYEWRYGPFRSLVVSVRDNGDIEYSAIFSREKPVYGKATSFHEILTILRELSSGDKQTAREPENACPTHLMK